MVAEPTADNYSDVELTAVIEMCPLRDRYGEPPTTTFGEDNSVWTPTYDMDAAAAVVWGWKAAELATDFDVTADGATLLRSQAYAQATKQASHYQARAAISSAPMLSRRDEAARHAMHEVGTLDEEDVAYEIVDGLSGLDT
jgi:hypothetical protein